MSNKFDSYDENDEITLSSTSNSKAELQIENNRLKRDLELAIKKIKDYEEVIKNTSVKTIGNDSNLSNDDLINIMCNSSVLVNKNIYHT